MPLLVKNILTRVYLIYATADFQSTWRKNSIHFLSFKKTILLRKIKIQNTYFRLFPIPDSPPLQLSTALYLFSKSKIYTACWSSGRFYKDLLSGLQCGLFHNVLPSFIHPAVNRRWQVFVSVYESRFSH